MQPYFISLISPDMICRDHDLSIYTANFLESDFSQNGQYDTLIWEGHGLMSWIMNQQEEVEIFGKSESKDHIDVYIELQPVSELN
jgi:hypothetical protein